MSVSACVVLSAVAAGAAAAPVVIALPAVSLLGIAPVEIALPLPDPRPPTSPEPGSPAPAAPGPTTPSEPAPPAPADPAPPAPPPAPAEPGAGPTPAPVPDPVLVALRRTVRQTHLLRPAPGRRIGSLRPVLRWRGLPYGTRIVNLQIFTTAGRAVHSVFPRARAYRVPAGVLRPGRRYIWRVWPHRERAGYTAEPLGVSWLSTPPRPRSGR